MKIKKKLRDLTEEEYKKLNCGTNTCEDCVLGNVNCTTISERCWVYHKDLYSDKFLDQEIEIEVERPKPTKEEITFLKKINPEWKWIAKDKNGNTCVFITKPTKDDDEWIGGHCSPRVFALSFDFLSWEDEEPTNIQKLIKEYGDE